MVQTPKKVSKLEALKERSNFLREPLATELLEDTTHFSNDAVQILKFHGSYQQDNRDNRVKGQEKDYRMMLRTRNPGGYIPPELYLAIDDISNRWGNKTIRATTRQGLQLHGILKHDLKKAIAAIVNNLGSTLGACGDLNRNVMVPPAPFKNKPEYRYAREYADKIADLLTPQSNAYYEIWLDGEKVISAEEAPEVVAARTENRHQTNIEGTEEPIYGRHYMPRKFKCSITVPGDNSVDLYTHDVSLVVITNKKGQLQGFNVFVGGGMGRTHNKEETFARVADSLGYVAKDDVFQLMKAIVATQRDYGDRFDRRHARMKYLLHDWGVDQFRGQVEQYFGKKIAPAKDLPDWKYQDYLGWHEQGDGKLFFGLSINYGRIKDEGNFQLKTALYKVIKRFHLPMRFSGNYNAVLYEINPSDRPAIEAIFQEHGVNIYPEAIDNLTRFATACPALPMCGLAITESERAMPGILERINTLLAQVGLKDEKIVVRMTGCPNGCARPYMAELGFVGIVPETYQLWLGGTPNQTALARTYEEKLPIDQLEKFLEPLLVYFRDERHGGESFGEFCNRVGFEALRAYAGAYQGEGHGQNKPRRQRKNQNRVAINDEVFAQLKAKSEAEQRPMNQIVAEALAQYFQG